MPIITKRLIQNVDKLLDTTNMAIKVLKPAKEVLELSEAPFNWEGFRWVPNFRNGIVHKYESKYQNLKLELKEDQMFIKNSLQKSFLKNNYQTYTYSQVQDAFKQLDTLFPFSIYDCSLTFISMGMVIQEELNSFYNNWLEYKGKAPLVMRNGHKIYGAHFKSTNYNIKAYEKTYQVKKATGIDLKASYMRYEIEAKPIYFNNRKNSIGIYSVADLVDKDKYQQLANELLVVYQNIKKQPVINYQILKPENIKLLATYSNTDASNGLKQHHKYTFKKERKIYLKLVREFGKNNIAETEFFNKLNQQIQYSINN